jgi:SpoVK/Ycf46/Vps4 family AAA+-type ATPase
MNQANQSSSRQQNDLLTFCIPFLVQQTQLARAMAGEASAAFIQVAPSDILSKFVGESETAVRGVFKKAADRALLLESKCAIVFFDEIDALGQTREDRGSGEGEGCSRRVLAELLMIMSEITDRKNRAPIDDFDAGKDDDVSIDTIQGTAEHARIIVIAATNRIDDLDPALKRRFGVQLPIDPPGTRERKEMILRQLDGIEYALSNDALNYFSGWLEGWTGSGLSSLVREAAMTPVRECLRKAAKMRKRPTRRNEQCGGDTSVQEESAGPTDPDLEAKTYLLNAIKTLRPVSDQDFVQAIHFLQPDTAPTSSPSTAHYDSSSDEEM